MKQSKLKIDFFSAFDLLMFWKDISRTNRPAVLRWKTEDITIAGITNVSGVAANQLNYPYDLVVDWSYALYVADSVNNRVQKFSKGSLNGVTVAGKADGSSGISDDSFNSANFLLVDDDSNMYVTDSKNHRIMYWKKNAAQGVVVAGTGKQNSVLSLMKWNSFLHRRYYW